MPIPGEILMKQLKQAKNENNHLNLTIPLSVAIHILQTEKLSLERINIVHVH